ncbi:MAG: HU family DNA-binding protein [Deltaproteobacteria bacterium]|nr:HU family DNA-binding protein [Deltaproteobacteria bacterium]
MAGKADIVDAVADAVEGLTKSQAAGAFEAVFEAISDSLSNGERVGVPGFGSFSISERAERTGRNPKTGEAMTIKASKNVRFKAGKQLKDTVNG